jgi:hypothetical protein
VYQQLFGDCFVNQATAFITFTPTKARLKASTPSSFSMINKSLKFKRIENVNLPNQIKSQVGDFFQSVSIANRQICINYGRSIQVRRKKATTAQVSSNTSQSNAHSFPIGKFKGRDNECDPTYFNLNTCFL